jgi:hypothetical protein
MRLDGYCETVPELFQQVGGWIDFAYWSIPNRP